MYFWRMRSRWYIGILLFIFTYVGIFHEQVSVPNQEIVLEFINEKIDQKDLENTIADLKEKLLEIGASNITIQQTNSSSLKISYYCVVHIDDIKETLLEENQLAFNQNPHEQKGEKDSIDYKINVYELTDTSNVANHNDKLVFNNKYISDRFSINDTHHFVNGLQVSKANQLFKTAYSLYKNNPFAKDCTSHREPDVRAGPQTYHL